jgi:UDP-N-acetylmuramyl pentapeptide synthase
VKQSLAPFLKKEKHVIGKAIAVTNLTGVFGKTTLSDMLVMGLSKLFWYNFRICNWKYLLLQSHTLMAENKE